MSPLQAAVQRSTFASGTFFCGKNFPLPRIQKEQVVSYCRKNVHLISTDKLHPGFFPETVNDHPDMTSAVYIGHKASNQINKSEIFHPSGDTAFSYYTFDGITFKMTSP